MSKAPPAPRAALRQKQNVALLERELARAQSRIQTVDLLTAGLVLFTGLLLYTLAVVSLDYWLRLPDWSRIVLFGFAGLAALAYAATAVVRPLIMRVNPYFAARRLEQSSPGSKNGLVNWLDLRERKLNPIIQDALQKNAVQELDKADVDEAIPARQPMRLGLIAGALLLGLFGYFMLMPDQIGSLMSRALLPFRGADIPTHTRIELLKPVEEPVCSNPETAEALTFEVMPGEPVAFAALIHGVTPESVILEHQPRLQEKPVRKTLNAPKDDAKRQPWTLTLPSDAIPADGLWFRLKAGDGQTRQFRLLVSSKKPPSVSEVEVTLNYPEYSGRRASRQNFAPIRALVGTKADIAVVADQAVKGGTLRIHRKNPEDQRTEQLGEEIALKPAPAPDGGQADPRRLVLEKPIDIVKEMRAGATYRLALTNTDNKVGTSPEYPIEAEDDRVPVVKILSLGQQKFELDQIPEKIQLVANAVVPVEGKAWDDVAVSEVRLRLRLKDGKDLFAHGSKPAEKNVQRATGFTPPPADWQLTLDLTKITDAPVPAGVAVPAEQYVKLTGGQALELWVEALDGAAPEPHVGKSAQLTIELTEPQDQKQRQEQEQQAQQKEKESKDKKEQKERQEQGQPDPNQKPEQGDQDQKQENKTGKGENKPDQGQDSKDDPNAKSAPNQKSDPSGKQAPDRKPDPNQKDDPNAKPSQDQKSEPKEPQVGKDQGAPNKDQKAQPEGKEGKDQGAPNRDQKAQPEGKEGSPKSKPDPKNPPQDSKQNQDQPSQGNQGGQSGKGQPQKGQPGGKDEGKPDGKDMKDQGDAKTQPGSDKKPDRQPNSKDKADQSSPKGDKNNAGGKDQQPSKERDTGKDQTGKDQTGKDQTGKDQTGKDQAGKDKAGKDQKLDPSKPDFGKPEDGKPAAKSAEEQRKSAQAQHKDRPDSGDGPSNSEKKPGEDGKKGDMSEALKPDPDKGAEDKGKSDQKDGKAKDLAQPGKADEKGEPKDGKTQPKSGEEKGEKAQDSAKNKGEKNDGSPMGQPGEGKDAKGDKEAQDSKNKGQGDKQQAGEAKPGQSQGNEGLGEKKDQAQKGQPGAGQAGGQKPSDQGKEGDEAGVPKEGGQPKPGQKGDQEGKGEKQPGQGGDQSSKQESGQGEPKAGQKGEGKGGMPGQGGDQPGDAEKQKKMDDLAKAWEKNNPDAKGKGKTGGGNLGEELPEVDKGGQHNKKATDLMLDDLRSKFGRGEIDAKLEKTLADANLTVEQAKQLLKDADRIRSAAAGRTSGPKGSAQDLRKSATLNRDARHQPPPELERAYRRFTEERARQSQTQQQPKQ